MFGNVFYFIIVLLIYSTYPPAEKASFTGVETIGIFFSLFIVFTGITFFGFRRLERQIARTPPSQFFHKYDALLTRQSILAVILFAVNIYGLGLPSFFDHILVFNAIPTLKALLFLGIFLFYLVIIWTFAYRSHILIQRIELSRRSHIGSNISFSIPVLLPWLGLSIVVDVIYLLPLDALQRLLATTAGQTGYFFFFLLIISIFGPLLIQRFWGCKPLARGIHRTRIEASCVRAGVEYAEILNWPIFGGRMITAGVMGLVRRFRYILVTPALLRFLDLKELDAVISHEIGHVKKKHLVFYLLFFMSLIWTILHSQIILGLGFNAALIYFEPLYWMVSSLGRQWFFSNSTIEAFLFIGLFFIYFRFVFGYFMRNFERQADIFAYEFQNDAGPLISSLTKIAIISGQPPEKPNWHHFSIRERIDYLRRCDADRRWVDRHHRKIRYSIIAYLVFIILLNGIGLELRSEETREKLNDYFVGTMLFREMRKAPDNAAVFQAAGDHYYIYKKDYQKAVEAYERAISLEPDNLHVLNNLAWLFATCEEETYRDPERALVLALKAVELEEAPHILDTLAESYYVNGRAGEAVLTEKRALSLANREDRRLFEKQLKKFEDMVSEEGGSR